MQIALARHHRSPFVFSEQRLWTLYDTVNKSATWSFAAYMNTLKISLKKLKIPALFAKPYFFPIFLFFICLMAFALFIPRLGFYWDDWPVIFMVSHGDLSNLQTFYLYDRPFQSFTYLLTVPMLGIDPQNWQVFALLFRFCTALSMYLVLRQVWPQRKFLAEGSALLFLVYPSFSQQSISVSYLPHFIAYTLFFLSVWFMLRAVREPKSALLYTVLGLAAGAYQILTVEYFTGLELIRPFVLFFMLRGQAVSVAQSWRKALRHWIPYMFLLLAFAGWRLFFATIPEDPNQASLLRSFVTAPLNATISFVQEVLRDFVTILFHVWQTALNPELINLADMSIVFSWGMGILAGVCVAVYLIQSSKFKSKVNEAKTDEWGAQAVGFGALALFLSMLPVHLIQKDLLAGLFADRLTMPAMFGAAIFWTGLAKLVLRSHFQRVFLSAVLVGLAVGLQIRISHSYALDWQKQSRIYWQLFWRTEAVEPNTPLIFNGALSGSVAEYAASAAINTLYNSPIENGRVNYWVFDYFDSFQGSVEDLTADTQIEAHQRNLTFEGSISQALFLHYSSGGQCLWLLNPQDENNLEIPTEFRQTAALANLNAINPSGGSQTIVDEEIFGEEPAQSWCYYFEKIDLARQNADWEAALSLWVEAQQKGLRPNNQVEMIPVIQTLVQTGKWQDAFDLSLTTFKRQPRVQPMLCSLWEQWKEEGSVPPEFIVTSGEVFAELGCQ